MRLIELFAEATEVAPNTREESDRLRELFSAPLTTECAASALTGIIHDDALNQEFEIAEPGTNALPIIHKWIELNKPNLLRGAQDLLGDGEGIFSLLHGYDDDDSPHDLQNLSSNYTA